jgi:XisI protein
LDLELLDLGVPKGDIVLGLHPPELRQFTGYAVQ